MAQNGQARRRREAEIIFYKIDNGTPEARVEPAIAGNLRQHMAQAPGEPDRALLAHLKDQMGQAAMPMNAVFLEDLSQGDEPPPTPPCGTTSQRRPGDGSSPMAQLVRPGQRATAPLGPVSKSGTVAR